MAKLLDHGGYIFTTGQETSFELPDSPTVTVSPLLTRADGHAADVFFLTIPAGAAVSKESHPFTETLVPLSGSLACALDDEEPVTVSIGQILHIPAGRVHHVHNPSTDPVVANMLIGV